MIEFGARFFFSLRHYTLEALRKAWNVLGKSCHLRTSFGRRLVTQSGLMKSPKYITMLSMAGGICAWSEHNILFDHY